MTARAGIDVADPWAAIEACYEHGWTDGLPVVPPTEALVERCSPPARGPPGEVLLHEPVRDRAVTAEKAAINAVMAGCRPEYFPVVGAALTAIGDPEFMLHGPATSTGGSALMVIVNGPFAARLGLNAGATSSGPASAPTRRSAATLRLVLLNCLDCRPGRARQVDAGLARQVLALLRRGRGGEPVGAAVRLARRSAPGAPRSRCSPPSPVTTCSRTARGDARAPAHVFADAMAGLAA